MQPALERGRPETREALLDAVDELLAERGIGACSLAAIARRAGLTTGAVYSTFGSRAALLAAALVRRSTEAAGLDPTCTDLRSAVVEFARRHARLSSSEEGRALLAVQLHHLRIAETDPTMAGALADAYATLSGQLTARFAELAPDREPGWVAVAARRLIAVLTGLTLQRSSFQVDVSEDDVVADALHAVGLAP